MFKPSLISTGLVGLLALSARAEPEVWQGKVGSAAIVMELDISSTSDSVKGRYFYRKYSEDIALEGKKTRNRSPHHEGPAADVGAAFCRPLSVP